MAAPAPFPSNRNLLRVETERESPWSEFKRDKPATFRVLQSRLGQDVANRPRRSSRLGLIRTRKANVLLHWAGPLITKAATRRYPEPVSGRTNTGLDTPSTRTRRAEKPRIFEASWRAPRPRVGSVWYLHGTGSCNGPTRAAGRRVASRRVPAPCANSCRHHLQSLHSTVLYTHTCTGRGVFRD